MLKKRIIPVVLLRNGVVVQSRQFKRYQALGSPTATVRRLSSWSSDELIYLDISPGDKYDLGRDDLNHPDFNSITDIIELVAEQCFVPLTFGGKIRTLADISMRLRKGADKIAINTAAHDQPDLISQCAKEFGSQVVVISIDAKRDDDGGYVAFKGGKIATDVCPFDLAREVQNRGAGEILINSIDRDGTGTGFDLDLITQMSEAVSIPVVALGGAGEWAHFEEVLRTDVSAVAAANIFHHSENSVYNCKKYLYDRSFNVRKPLKLINTKRHL